MADFPFQRKPPRWQPFPRDMLVRDWTDGPFTEEVTREVAEELIQAGGVQDDAESLRQFRYELNDVAHLYKWHLYHQEREPSALDKREQLQGLVRALSRADAILSREEGYLGPIAWFLSMHYQSGGTTGQSEGRVQPQDLIADDLRHLRRMLAAAGAALADIPNDRAGSRGLGTAARVLIADLADRWEGRTGTRAAVYKAHKRNTPSPRATYATGASIRFILAAATVIGAGLKEMQVIKYLERSEPLRKERRGKKLSPPPA